MPRADTARGSPDVDGNRRGRPHRSLRALFLVATGATLLLVGLGGLVRATGSGDACPDWPRCHGSWIPPVRYHELIEYSHRLLASVVVVLVAAVAWVAWRRYRSVRGVLFPAIAGVVLVLGQALLGAVVVWSGLEAVNVTAHLATAMLLAGVLVYGAVRALSLDAARRSVDGLTVLARAAAGSVFGLMLAGALVRAEGAALAFRDWPLMDGRIVPELDAIGPAVHFVHRVLAAVVGLIVAWLAARAWRERGDPPHVAALALLAAGLFAGQVLVGAANVWTALAAPAVVAHVLLGALVWGSLVATAAASRVCPRRETPLRHRPPAAVRRPVEVR